MMCYIVKGNTGFWQDYTWNVRIFGSLEKAKEFVSKLQNTVDNFAMDNQNMDDLTFREALTKLIKPLDNKVYVVDCCLDYVIDECELDSQYIDNNVEYMLN